MGVDGVGNFLEPDGGTRSLNIYQGPGMCGALAGNIADPYGQPSDASSPDALTGKIALGNIFDNSSASGSVSICTLAGGCTDKSHQLRNVQSCRRCDGQQRQLLGLC